jgi:hypothetical protein
LRVARAPDRFGVFQHPARPDAAGPMDASTLVFLVTVGLTSLGARALGRASGARGGWASAPRAWIPIEALGLGMLFLAANVVVATVAILIGRAISEEYVPIYVLDDGAMLAASLVQGVWFRLGRLGSS